MLRAPIQVSDQEREALRQRPNEPVAIYQKWRDLLFMHFPCDPAEVKKLIPDGLDLDLYPDETGNMKAWIGLVPFRMEGIRFARASLPGSLTAFPETNVRTYVHRNGKDPGVWFFSLDAAKWIACKYARMQYGLPYWHAKMSVRREREKILYDSHRLEGAEDGKLECVATIGPAIGICEPGSQDYFLLERYLLYSEKAGVLHKARVWHRPYPIRGALVESCNQSLTFASKLPTYPWKHVIFSDGVDVEIFKTHPVE